MLKTMSMQNTSEQNIQGSIDYYDKVMAVRRIIPIDFNNR